MTWFEPPCIAPKCEAARQPGSLFCRDCEQASAARRGGWLSAYKRRKTMAIDASNVFTRLWVGGQPPFDRGLPGFDVLVLCAQELQPEHLAFEGRVIRCPIPDGQLDTDQIRKVLGAAGAAAKELARGRRVLITCAAGINRSALVACFALAHVTRMTGTELIQLMRQKRAPSCLYNPHFQYLIHRLIGDAPRVAIR